MGDPKVQFIQPDGLFRAPGYTAVVSAQGGRTVYISGQVALDAQGHLVGPGDFEVQARQCFVNIGRALEAAGLDFTHVVKLGLFVLDTVDVPTLRRVRDEFVNTAQPPASTLVQVAGLFRSDLLVEVEAIAVGPA